MKSKFNNFFDTIDRSSNRFFIVWLLWKKEKEKNHFTIESNAYKFSSKYFSISSIVSRVDSAESIEMGYPVYEPSGYPYSKY